MSLICEEERVTVTPFGFRPDLLAHHKQLPAEGAALRMPVCVGVNVGAGVSAGVGVEVRDTDATGAAAGFVAAIKARGGRVLELGARIVGSMTEGRRGRFEPECQ